MPTPGDPFRDDCPAVFLEIGGDVVPAPAPRRLSTSTGTRHRRRSPRRRSRITSALSSAKVSLRFSYRGRSATMTRYRAAMCSPATAVHDRVDPSCGLKNLLDSVTPRRGDVVDQQPGLAHDDSERIVDLARGRRRQARDQPQGVEFTGRRLELLPARDIAGDRRRADDPATRRTRCIRLLPARKTTKDTTGRRG